MLPGNQHDAFQCGTRNFCKSIFESLASVWVSMSRNITAATMPDADAIMDLFQAQLQGAHDFALHCPSSTPSYKVIGCTYHHCFQPYSKRGGTASGTGR